MSNVVIKVPWKQVMGLGPHIADRTPTSVDALTAEICGGIIPAPLIEGTENLPANPCFVLAANHYQLKGPWILFPTAILTQVIRQHYGPTDPPVRWPVRRIEAVRLTADWKGHRV